MRVDRLIHGNPGNHRNLTEGVSELKIDVGPRLQGVLLAACGLTATTDRRRRQVNAGQGHRKGNGAKPKL